MPFNFFLENGGQIAYFKLAADLQLKSFILIYFYIFFKKFLAREIYSKKFTHRLFLNLGLSSFCEGGRDVASF